MIKLRNWIILFKFAWLLVMHDGGKLSQVGKLPYLPVYNAHFFYDIWGWKITLRIIHGTFCFRSATHLHKQKKQWQTSKDFKLSVLL